MKSHCASAKLREDSILAVRQMSVVVSLTPIQNPTSTRITEAVVTERKKKSKGYVRHRLTVLALLQRQQIGSRLKGELLKLAGHGVALGARGRAWRSSNFHTARLWLRPFL